MKEKDQRSREKEIKGRREGRRDGNRRKEKKKKRSKRESLGNGTGQTDKGREMGGGVMGEKTPGEVEDWK